MSHAAKRAAYRGVALVLKQHWQDMPVGPVGMLDEVQRIINAMESAGAIEDGPGVEGHVSGDGKGPTTSLPYTWTCWRCNGTPSQPYATAAERDAAAELHARATHPEAKL